MIILGSCLILLLGCVLSLGSIKELPCKAWYGVLSLLVGIVLLLLLLLGVH